MNDPLYSIASSIYFLASALFILVQVICTIHNTDYADRKINFGTVAICMLILAVFMSLKTVHFK